MWAKVIKIEETIHSDYKFNEDKNNVIYTVILDVLNDNMKKRDEELYNIITKRDQGVDLNKEEKDTFISNYMYISFMKIEFTNKEVLDTLNQFKDDWFKLKIVEIEGFKNTLKSISSMIGTNDVLIKKYREIIENNSVLINNEKNWILKSEWIFSASPIISKQYLIEIINKYEEDNKKPTNLPVPQGAVFSTSQEILEYIKDLNDYECKKIRINHVGQGHNSMIFNENEEFIFYDLGSTLSPKKDKSNKIKKEDIDISKCKMSIISHWDLDHYLGISLCDYKELFNKCWIAPNIINSQIAGRIINIIFYIKNKKFLIPSNVDIDCFKIGRNLDVYINKSDEKKDYINNNGLSIYINKDAKDKELLKFVSVGDVSYEKSHEEVKKECKIDILVVSHHGSKNYTQSIFEGRDDKSLAIIPVGYNSHNHPNKDAINDLKNNKFNIKRTDGIDVNLGCEYECNVCSKKCNIDNDKFIEIKLSNSNINIPMLEKLEGIISGESLIDKDTIENINNLQSIYGDEIEQRVMRILEDKIEVLCEEFSEKYFEQNVIACGEDGEDMLINGSVNINLFSDDLDIEYDDELIKYLNNINKLTRGNIEFIKKLSYNNVFEYELIYPDANNDNEDVCGICNIHINFELDTDRFELEAIE